MSAFSLHPLHCSGTSVQICMTDRYRNEHAPQSPTFRKLTKAETEEEIRRTLWQLKSKPATSTEEAYRRGFVRALVLAAEVCMARYMGDNNREDMEARRCAEAIRAISVPDSLSNSDLA